MKFKPGDKVRTTKKIDEKLFERVIDQGTKGIVTGAYPHTHSSFPYDVRFKGESTSVPVAGCEIELIVPWYQRLKNWWRKPAILDAETHFGTQETRQAFLEINTVPGRSVVSVPIKVRKQ